MIIRVPHRRRYTVIANGALRDARLSFRATGVLAYLLSLPDGSEISGRRLADIKSEGRDAIIRALDELNAAGYLDRDRYQVEGGRWTTALTIRELPTPENPVSEPGNRTLTSHQPTPGKPTPGNPDSKEEVPEEKYQEPTPGNPTPAWADQPMWQDDKGRWYVGEKPDEAAS